MMVAVMAFSAAAQDGTWKYQSSNDPFAPNFGASAVYKNGYDEIGISPTSAGGTLRIYVKYWEKNAKTSPKVKVAFSLHNGRTANAEFTLTGNYSDWQGTVHAPFMMHYDDLSLFKSASSVKFHFDNKVMTVPMSNFNSAIDQALSDQS